jgi:hypothetical protein
MSSENNKGFSGEDLEFIPCYINNNSLMEAIITSTNYKIPKEVSITDLTQELREKITSIIELTNFRKYEQISYIDQLKDLKVLNLDELEFLSVYWNCSFTLIIKDEWSGICSIKRIGVENDCRSSLLILQRTVNHFTYYQGIVNEIETSNYFRLKLEQLINGEQIIPKILAKQSRPEFKKPIFIIEKYHKVENKHDKKISLIKIRSTNKLNGKILSKENLKNIKLWKREERRVIARYLYFIKDMNFLQIRREIKMGRNQIKRWVRAEGIHPGFRKVRKGKFSKEMIDYIRNRCENKWSVNDNASIRIVTSEVNNRFATNVHFTSVQRILDKIFPESYKPIKTFKIKPETINQRIKFAEYVFANKLTGDSFFFTDEKKLMKTISQNKHTNRIRLSYEMKFKLENAQSPISKLLH